MQARIFSLVARIHQFSRVIQRSRLARCVGARASLLTALILALTGLPPAGADQKVAMPNGKVLHFGGTGSTHSNNIMREGSGPPSVLWYILNEKPVVWDPGDKEEVVRWMNSNTGQSLIRRWMERGDSHGTVYRDADTKLRSYLGVTLK
jgi:hypothetical protein